MPDDLKHFKVSSGIKNIIGSELITDDFVAVFELVKNSFDAHAKNVLIKFENIHQPDLKKSRLIIQDDGKGMTRLDIEKKWLWVGYSAKKDNSEDLDIESSDDYRKELSAKRAYAGAKGIGRFSCDRLGRYLTLYSRRDPNTPELECVIVDWKNFEEDDRIRFEDVEIDHDSITSNPFSLNRGTVLEITNLRKIWTRSDLQLLRKELQKLIVPEEGEAEKSFKVVLSVPDESQNDLRHTKEEPINGPIKNFLFERLELKTTQIVCKVSDSGKFIETTLLDQNRLIYRLVEQNREYHLLPGVTFRIFYLNRASKLAFNSLVGVAPIKFGSVFVYKNGFRVQPYGREEDDSFAIDRRKVQGTSRFLGNRDIVGRIQIRCNDSRFKEASSRNAGFIESPELDQLSDFLRRICLRRLELYVVDVIKWGNPITETFDQSQPITSSSNKEELLKLIAKLTDSSNVENFEVGQDVIEIVSANQESSVKSVLANFERLAAQGNNPTLEKEARRIRREMDVVLEAKEEAEKSEKKERERAKQAEDEAQRAYSKAAAAEEAAKQATISADEAQAREQQVVTQNIFLRSVLSHDLDHLLKLHHTIGQDALTIEKFVRNLLELINNPSDIRPENLKVPLERISFRANRILSITRFATRANHIAASEEHTGDLLEYIREYIANVLDNHIAALSLDDRKIPIFFSNPEDLKFITSFSPLDVSVVFDNLLSNSRKHASTEIRIKVNRCDNESLSLSFRDNGKGIPRKNEPQLFNPGFSTTDGSGLGLCHVKEIMETLQGSITYRKPDTSGAEFILTFPKNEN